MTELLGKTDAGDVDNWRDCPNAASKSEGTANTTAGNAAASTTLDQVNEQ